MKTCPDCGSRVYNLGCTWCNEAAYIQEQVEIDGRRFTEMDGDKYIATLDNGRAWPQADNE